MTLRIDLHCHTRYSTGCGWMRPVTLADRAEAAGLDAIAVTDHNTMDGVDAVETAASDEIQVIPGEEIDTTHGQIIGLFLTDRISPWQDPRAVFEEIERQDGLALAPHPFDPFRAGLDPMGEFSSSLDMIEVCNARCLRQRYNETAVEFARDRSAVGTGGSDAHFPCEVGNAHTVVTGGDSVDDDRDLRDAFEQALAENWIEVSFGRTNPLIHGATKLVKVARSAGVLHQDDLHEVSE